MPVPIDLPLDLQRALVVPAGLFGLSTLLGQDAQIAKREGIVRMIGSIDPFGNRQGLSVTLVRL